ILDVQTPQLNRTRLYWAAGLALIVLIGLALRLHGIHDPMLDHPGWRQGDTAAIARNFARLQFDIMRPQTMYNGAPPHYVELELQIVPFLAAIGYKAAGIHEIFGRLVTLTFSLATVVTLAYFGRWLFGSALAGLAAAFCYAVFPGSIYYGRTFMPDGAMVFFLTAGLYATALLLSGDVRPTFRATLATTLLLAVAYLAKPVAAIAVVPVLAMAVERARAKRAMGWMNLALLLVIPFLILALYDRRVASYAEWHWASGITQLHVLPALHRAFANGAGFAAKLAQFWDALGMLRETMLGKLCFALSAASFVALPWIPMRSKSLLWSWLAVGLVYVYVVVTVERVDYYMYPLLPLAALAIGGATARSVAGVRASEIAAPARYALLGFVALLGLAALALAPRPIAAYYHYNKEAYRSAVALDRVLPKNALVVIAHYGPDVQYYMDRFGWEEDPALWTPFDEESAIRKGSRYFVSIEDARLRRNAELCAWLTRFPLLETGTGWPVYETDPAKAAPNAERFWRAFRSAQRAGAGRAFLDAHHLCARKS
ncbi:MAG TPA: phospholipid carrier-dependent glycosyltransferase, partial [Candidatus Nitrosotalea sp.]|nr:phospholipid carrier-dependent glycosyltransferase [Candidatus Nitrosotalea sp.]